MSLHDECFRAIPMSSEQSEQAKVWFLYNEFVHKCKNIYIVSNYKSFPQMALSVRMLSLKLTKINLFLLSYSLVTYSWTVQVQFSKINWRWLSFEAMSTCWTINWQPFMASIEAIGPQVISHQMIDFPRNYSTWRALRRPWPKTQKSHNFKQNRWGTSIITDRVMFF